MKAILTCPGDSSVGICDEQIEIDGLSECLVEFEDDRK
jgi:hypothetical protein